MFDDLRIAVARVDALASAAEELFDNTLWGGEVDRQRLERAAHLIGLTRESAEAALNAVDAFNADALNPTITADAKSEPEAW
jgi:hypothetical protein